MSAWSMKTIGASCDSGSRRMREPVTTMSADLPSSLAAGAGAAGAAAAGASAGGGVLCASAGAAANATASATDALVAFSKA